MFKLIIYLKQFLYRLKAKLWFKPTAYCLLAILGVSICYFLQEFKIFNLYPKRVTAETVTTLLSIINTSMLVVVTFAVGSMISAYTSASKSGTPRVLTLLLQDNISKKATSSFIGAFIFGIVATIGVKSNSFNHSGIFLIFVLTISVIGWVIFTFILWIDSIARLGQIKILPIITEKQAKSAIDNYIKNPYKSCHILVKDQIPENAIPIYSKSYGFLTDIDFATLNNFCKEKDTNIYIVKPIGSHLTILDRVAYIETTKNLKSNDLDQIFDSFILSDERIYSEDPIFCLELLDEIAGKALSPGINDPRTAISVIDSSTRLIDYLLKNNKEDSNVIYEKIFMTEIPLEEFIKSGFEFIRTYGSNNLLVSKKLQASLLHIYKQASLESDKKAILEYTDNCYSQALNELKQGFEQLEFKNYRDSITPTK
ncbi:DUF2254 domain-containing protein [Francisella frigiditurris]|uniref:DUF2254 domain-containing protein n=1 Tax=Francisella frigiditurris TaxID=1542390 RepID=A0A1J0KU77_9GAMM|nr:DUF2254 family protein [Francisella frigiditurris]APC97188.1 hypothetical protein KX01_888 [Francisella frigiditurris]